MTSKKPASRCMVLGAALTVAVAAPLTGAGAARAAVPLPARTTVTAAQTAAVKAEQGTVTTPLGGSPLTQKTVGRVGVVPGELLLGLAPGHGLGSVLGAAGVPRGSSARAKGGGLYVLQLAGRPSAAETQSDAAELAKTPGVAYAMPDEYVSSMQTAATPVPAAAGSVHVPAATTSVATASGLPTNYAVSTSLQAMLNSGGIDALGAYATLDKDYGQLPGTGEIITNVSVGDLTDSSMHDPEVAADGPTTVVQNGQRYLDIPSMPLIPTYTSDDSGVLNPVGSIEGEDPSDGEVLLDFSVMAPLPDGDQRPGATGSGVSDLLGIAPGAQYRLVVPTDPSGAGIASALMAAAQQSPHPDVITASLGWGTDVTGFPGRYLEDDPLVEATVASIVQQLGITVVISANDGTRTFTPAAIGPDGGSTATDLARSAHRTTNINDDQDSTAPTQVVDSGAIAAGATTLDDTLVAGDSGANGVYAATRVSGAGDYSSGYGSRVDLSAPGDGIAAFVHDGSTAESVGVEYTGGTSAAAPEIAASAAVLLQSARLTGRSLNPAQVRDLLERTGRSVATPGQIDQRLDVGTQVDLTAAVDAELAAGHYRGAAPATGADRGRARIVRIGVEHHQILGGLGSEYSMGTDPASIDLQGPGTTGEGLAGPVLFAADLTGVSPDAPGMSYAVKVGGTTFRSPTPAVRMTPTALLTAAGDPVVATAARTIGYLYEVLDRGRLVTSQAGALSLSASDGRYAEAPAPSGPSSVNEGSSVTVSYDLSHVDSSHLSDPQLIVSTVSHWNPLLAQLFTPAYQVDLTGLTGTVTIPASAFDDGAGIYGIGIGQGTYDNKLYQSGEFTSILVKGPASAADRPAAPLLGTAGAPADAHEVAVTRESPTFELSYDVSKVRGADGKAATGVELEASAPAPSVLGSWYTFSNPYGDQRDHDGVDTGSALFRHYTGTSGTLTLDALSLGLRTSLHYSLRVLAVDAAGDVIGQASPTSMLDIDDGVVPNGAIARSFAMAGADSVVAVDEADGSAQVLPYDPSTGRYGSPITEDSDPRSVYDVVGVDASLNAVELIHAVGSTGETRLETWNVRTGKEVGQVVVDPKQYLGVMGGRVDAVHHLADFLTYTATTHADTVLEIDLGTGQTTTAVDADTSGVGPAAYGRIDVDSSTGTVVLTENRGMCVGAPSGSIAEVDTVSGTVTASPAGIRPCIDSAASDQAGHVDLTECSSVSVNFSCTSDLQTVGEGTFTGPTGAALRQEMPEGLAADGVHGLALVEWPVPDGPESFGSNLPLITDNNATSQVAVLDAATGKLQATVSGFGFVSLNANVVSPFGGDWNADTERTLQLDPSTRTGWVISPDGTQIQQFTY
jgi:hypothetical protein